MSNLENTPFEGWYLKNKHEEFKEHVWPYLSEEIQNLLNNTQFFKNCYEGTRRFLIIDGKEYDYELPLGSFLNPII